ncbi:MULTISPECIES: PfkB family carbohydrate kinase [unclassified Roseitalea]|uniref:PfkB family carbohydrate kinase n=1 Tax=unclassified Roseitalea TaxID=2639107 RepID=UPI00273F660E|nr:MULTISPECIES: PfkB family carbohydrate kinase [unclassified Roseitalea]
MARLWFLGEALIDFVPVTSPEGPAFAPRPGGSPFNAAKAAALAGGDAAFLGAISTDLFGTRLADDLAAHGVATQTAIRGADPTTLAFVELDHGEARYAFFNKASGTSLIDPDPARFDPGPDDVLHVGSIALIDQPGADNIARFAEAAAGRVRLCLDPNARPAMMPDIEAWRARLRRLCDRAAIIKVSAEDLDCLAPGISASDFAHTQLARGTDLVLVTRGADGAVAFAHGATVERDGFSVTVADTVGAGDTVTGFLLADLAARGLTAPGALATLEAQALGATLDLALAAAAMTCTRTGCRPPRRPEAEAFLAQARRSA